MTLEVIHRLPAQAASHPPLLFVHGAFTSARCWDEHFLPYFAEQGYPAYALSLRGHGDSCGPLYNASLSDYATDVMEVAGQFDVPPVLIGHSMGGMVVQKCLEKQYFNSAILMNSVPPSGILFNSFYMAMSNPWLWQQIGLMQTFGPHFTSPGAMREALFSKDMKDEDIIRHFDYAQGESQRVVIDMMGFNLPNPMAYCTRIPVLVLGAENDAFLPPGAVHMTAAAYQAEAHIFKNMAHAMMLEKRWQSVADYILQWLHSQTLDRPMADAD